MNSGVARKNGGRKQGSALTSGKKDAFRVQISLLSKRGGDVRGEEFGERSAEAEMKRKDIEMVRLKEKNNGLIKELKRLNELLDEKVKRMGLGPATIEGDSGDQAESKMIQEMECLSKMGMMYERELEVLEAKLSIKADPERVLQLEREVTAQKATQDEKQKRRKRMELKLKELERALEKASVLRASEFVEHEERRLLKELNNEHEKQTRLQQRTMKDNDVILFRDQKIRDTSGKTDALERELCELKAIAENNAARKEQKREDPRADKQELQEEVRRLQLEVETEGLQNSRRMQEQENVLNELKHKLREVAQNNKVNSHRILEVGRLVRIGKTRHSSVLPESALRAEQKREQHNAKQEKLAKYKRMKLKKVGQVSGAKSEVELGIQTSQSVVQCLLIF